MLCTHVSILSFDCSRGDLEALDTNGHTPILTAAEYANNDALDAMVEKGGDSLSSTLFEAAKKPDRSNIKALEVPL